LVGAQFFLGERWCSRKFPTEKLLVKNKTVFLGQMGGNGTVREKRDFEPN